MGKAQVRLDPDIAADIADAAEANDRSMTQEVNARLRETLPQSQPGRASLTGANVKCLHARRARGRCLLCGERVD